MLNEGLTTMLVGMATVFLFLLILWYVVALLGKVVSKLNELFPEQAEQVQKAVQKASADVDVAIAVASAKFRR
jgi:sodium pump decarboxylase gamma subunit